ncbi:MAG TPA: SEC-C metal-binding domain-containing protein [Planktothrix sp.]
MKSVPSFKVLDSKMQEGYKLSDRDEPAAALVWFEVWNDVLAICDKSNIKTIGEFDKRFNGTQLVSNWVSDYQMVLWNSGLKNAEFLRQEIAFCEELLRRFGSEESLRDENARRYISECYAEMGQSGKVDERYEEWLGVDEHWGWGWIGWSDCYHFAKRDSQDMEKAERLLRKGLSISEVRDRDDITERLADLLETVKRDDEASELRSHLTPKLEWSDRFESDKVDKKFLEVIQAALENSQPEARGISIDTNPNRPCPCNSGKRFKKCCGRGLR